MLDIGASDTWLGSIGPGREPPCKGTSGQQAMIAAGRISKAAWAVTSGMDSRLCGLSGTCRTQGEPVLEPVRATVGTSLIAAPEGVGEFRSRSIRAFRNLRRGDLDRHGRLQVRRVAGLPGCRVASPSRTGGCMTGGCMIGAARRWWLLRPSSSPPESSVFTGWRVDAWRLAFSSDSVDLPSARDGASVRHALQPHTCLFAPSPPPSGSCG